MTLEENRKKFYDNFVDDGIAGVYLIGTSYYNPETKKAEYCIKIGTTTDVAKRLSLYFSHNPSVWLIDFKEYQKNGFRQRFEIKMHQRCQDLGFDAMLNSKEWFKVSAKSYQKICKNGFDAF